jgi:hypothetical protein
MATKLTMPAPKERRIIDLARKRWSFLGESLVVDRSFEQCTIMENDAIAEKVGVEVKIPSDA